MNCVKIGNFEISNYGTPFIVAEAGINHNGDIDRAFQMIDVAKKSGADAVKFQTFKAAEFVADAQQIFTYKSQGRTISESMLNMFRRCEFSQAQWEMIKRKCDRAGIMFLSTPQNPSDLELLLKLGIEAIKVGSDDFTNIPLLKRYATTGLPIILSCGMSDRMEVDQALDAVGFSKGYPTILLVCTSLYPTPPGDANLSRIRSLSKDFPTLPIGFSDHTQGPLASSLAIALGAALFEKHFTLSHDLPGPDHWFSENPTGVKDWIKSIKKAYLMMGDGIVRPTKQEKINKKEFQRVIVALRDILQGEKFDLNNIGMRRVPGGKGLSPSLYESFLGKPSKRLYRKGQAIKL